MLQNCCYPEPEPGARAGSCSRSRLDWIHNTDVFGSTTLRPWLAIVFLLDPGSPIDPFESASTSLKEIWVAPNLNYFVLSNYKHCLTCHKKIKKIFLLCFAKVVSGLKISLKKVIWSFFFKWQENNDCPRILSLPGLNLILLDPQQNNVPLFTLLMLSYNPKTLS